MLSGSLISGDALRSVFDQVRLLDCRSGEAGRAAYRESHLRGAVHADLDRDLAATVKDAAIGGRHPLPAIDAWTGRLGKWGIGPDTPVVVYDDQGGANAAARCWWMLRASGHVEVAVLDGGWSAAVAADLPREAVIPEVDPVAPYPAAAWQLPIATMEKVDAVRRSRDWLLVDARDSSRYRGENEPYDPLPGHIPGAVSSPYRDNLSADGRFESPQALAARYSALLGEVPAERVVAYCGSGVTACHTLLALEIAGLPGGLLYVGSWSEWCRSDRPRATGG
jgi:thiosulfate/3-mercaptopyruvate sulfurtransferase